MLQQILDLFAEANGRPLSKDALCTYLDLSPAVLDHMLHTLVRRGHLVALEGLCDGCPVCPLKQVCAGVPAPRQMVFALAPRQEQSPSLIP